jgi:hypothetical protein
MSVCLSVVKLREIYQFQLGEVSYHRYRGIVVTNEEKLELSHDLGRKSKVMILHNHGLVSLGSTVEEAFANIVLLVNACEYQVSALAVGLNNIIIPDVDASSTVVGVDVTANGMTWGLGEMEWEAEMRILDMQVNHSACLSVILSVLLLYHFPTIARVTGLDKYTEHPLLLILLPLPINDQMLLYHQLLHR